MSFSNGKQREIKGKKRWKIWAYICCYHLNDGKMNGKKWTYAPRILQSFNNFLHRERERGGGKRKLCTVKCNNLQKLFSYCTVLAIFACSEYKTAKSNSTLLRTSFEVNILKIYDGFLFYFAPLCFVHLT